MRQAGLESGSFTTFGALLKHLRRRARLTQRELAIAVGYSETYITRLENDTRLPDPSAVKAHFLDALRLRDEPETARRLIDLAEQARKSSPSTRSTLHAPRFTNLPAPLTRLVGRERELAEVARLLGTSRLVTLTGSGGVGKTRLAVEVGLSLAGATPAVAPAFPDGAWLVELAPLADPGLVADLTATALGLASSSRTALDVLVSHLRDKQALLLLDNCEHLVQACAELADALLRACPRLHILATSRERLNVYGETAWRVPSLSDSESLQLFVERAGAVRPDFILSSRNGPAAAAVCQHLDGIPLAIELAASRLNGMSVEELAARLGDRFQLLSGGHRTALPRQQTLRAAIDWSYDLLSEPERALLRRLSVFASGWTAEAAEAVCADGKEEGKGAASLHPSDIMPLLLSLIDKSLVVADEYQAEMRYRLLETIREYAWEQLAACGEADAARRRHACYYLSWVQENAPPEMRRTGAPVQFGLMAGCLPWLQQLDAERDNLRAAMTRCLCEASEPADVETGVQLVLWLFVFWSIRGPRPEGREWLERALAHTDPFARARARARLLCALVDFVQRMGEGVLAEPLAREALAICRVLGDRYDLMIALWRFADLSHVPLEESRSAIEEWLSIAREIGDARYTGIALWYLGGTYRSKWNLPRAAALYDEACRVLPPGEEGARHIARYCQGMAMWEQFGSERGMAHVHEALAFFRQAGFELGIIQALHWLGDKALVQGDLATARQHLRESLRVSYRDGAWGMVIGCVVSLAALAATEGQNFRAITLGAAAGAVRVPNDLADRARPPGDFHSRVNAARVYAAREQLDPQALAAAEAAGRAMSLDQAVEYALAE